MFLAWTCACVSVVRSPPSPSFLSLSPSRISLSSPPPSFCVFPALLSLLAVSGEQQRLHYRQGERVLPPPHSQTHTFMCVFVQLKEKCTGESFVSNLLKTSEVTVAHLVRLVCCAFSLFLVSDFLSKNKC